MNTTSLSGLMRDKRAQAAAAVGAVIGLIVFMRKGSSGSSGTSATMTGSNGSLGGLYTGGGATSGGGVGGDGANSGTMDAYTKQLSTITELLANLTPASIQQPTTATAVPTAKPGIVSLGLSPTQAQGPSQLQKLFANATPGSAAQFRIAEQLASAPKAAAPSPILGKLKYLPMD